MQKIEPYFESPALRRAAQANSSPRKLRALARLLDEEIGPDTSLELYRFEDGWTVRLVESLNDRRRDGWLMKACLRGARLERTRSWLSLRDPEQIPHVLFHAYSIKDANPEIVELFDFKLDDRTELVALAGAVGRGNSEPKRIHLIRLHEFALAARVDDPGVTIGPYVLLPFPIRSLSFGAALTRAVMAGCPLMETFL